MSERGGFIAQLAVLAIMVILLAVIALVVVNALKSSPWATFTLAMTIPIALLLGVYLRFVRPGRVLEASVIVNPSRIEGRVHDVTAFPTVTQADIPAGSVRRLSLRPRKGDCTASERWE